MNKILDLNHMNSFFQRPNPKEGAQAKARMFLTKISTALRQQWTLLAWVRLCIMVALMSVLAFHLNTL